MGVKLVSASGGSVEINPPATASSFTATMPAGTGNVVVNGVNGALVAATAQASTSGTSIDFTGIPSWVKRITVMFSGVSTSGTSTIQVQVGSGSFQTSGYVATGVRVATNSTTAGGSLTSGFPINVTPAAADIISGSLVLTTISANTWVGSLAGKASTSLGLIGGGDVALSGTLDRVRITTVNGTDTFDAGTINILYE